MTRVTIIRYYNNYSEATLNQIVATCKGQPLYSVDGKALIGDIVSGVKIEGKGVEFVVEVEAI